MRGPKSFPTAAHWALSESFCVHSSHCEPLCITLGTSEEFLTAWADSGCDPFGCKIKFLSLENWRISLFTFLINVFGCSCDTRETSLLKDTSFSKYSKSQGQQDERCWGKAVLNRIISSVHLNGSKLLPAGNYTSLQKQFKHIFSPG